jgi:zinc protease
VGDVRRDDVLAMVMKYFGEWKRGSYAPDIPDEPSQNEPREAHVDWPSETLPVMYIGFRAPAYSDEKKDKPALDLLGQIAFSETSDIYQKLVLKEQKLDSLSYIFEDRMDPELFFVSARVKDAKDMDYVRQQILDTYKRYTKELVPKAKLDSTRSRARYSFALAMNSSEAIANNLASYIGLRRTPATLEKLFAVYDSITPEDIRSAADKYFVDKHRTIVTLTTKKEVAK